MFVISCVKPSRLTLVIYYNRFHYSVQCSCWFIYTLDIIWLSKSSLSQIPSTHLLFDLCCWKCFLGRCLIPFGSLTFGHDVVDFDYEKDYRNVAECLDLLLTYAASAETKKQKRNRSFFISRKKKQKRKKKKKSNIICMDVTTVLCPILKLPEKLEVTWSHHSLFFLSKNSALLPSGPFSHRVQGSPSVCWTYSCHDTPA